MNCTYNLMRFLSYDYILKFLHEFLNASELARSLGALEATARRYIDLLGGAFVVRQLPPWFEDLGKRQVKSPKIYLRDSGLFHTMQNVETGESLVAHGKAGTSWESFVIEQLAGMLGERNLFFWATHAGAKLDVFTVSAAGRFGFECKLTDAPRTTKSMQITLSDLALSHLFVVFPGKTSYRLSESITALAITDIFTWQYFLR